MKRAEIRIEEAKVQKAVMEFTKSSRHWTAWAAHEIEHILRFYKGIKDDFHYARFDADNNELVFLGPPVFDAPPFEVLDSFVVERDFQPQSPHKQLPSKTE